ncbi:MAG: LPS export ABC transporter ATP-binding protein [Magnetococcales bacterium]|nr:LPS export ABC transporter ATP-binding protein [Magnetococcales bacterium]MBF0113516.1 LPS export ABC transporter ATP-binding protein [Magnetococcales bacterium]
MTAETDGAGPLPGQALQVTGLGKSYHGRKVVTQVDLSLAPGEVVGLLGPNGAGKTTTFYMIVGLVAADEGEIALDGRQITHIPMYQRARAGISYLPQEPSIFRKMNVRDNVLSILETLPLSRSERLEKLDHLLNELGVLSLAESPGYALSGGERRRVEVARALAIEPRYILLDEPFAGVDPLAVEEIQTLIRHLQQRGIGVLITDHNVRETLGICDRAYVMTEGKVLAHGRPEHLVQNELVRVLYLGKEFQL